MEGGGNAKEYGVNFKNKFQEDMEIAVMEWMDKTLDITTMCDEPRGPDGLKKKLDDGILLCELMNKIKPGAIPKFMKKDNLKPFQKRENIGRFNDAIRQYGVKPEYIFVTEDLYSAKNLTQVLIGLRALGTKAASKGVEPKIAELRQDIKLDN